MSDSDHRILVIASGDAARCAEAAAAAVGAGCVRVDSRVPDGLDPGPWSTVLLAGEISSAVLDGMRDRLGSVPVMALLTGADQIEDALDAGADDFVLLPCVPEVLAQRLRLLLRGAPTETAAPDAAEGDALTSLPGSDHLARSLASAIQRADRTGEKIAVLHLDLDRFATINETLGRDLGDRLLLSLADRLRTSLRGTDTMSRAAGGGDIELSRESGDEFRLMLAGLDSEFQPGAIATRLLAAIARPVELDGTEIFVTASGGLAVFPEDADSAAELMRCAETAVAHAKHAGGNSHLFYSSRMNREAAARLDLASRLHRGIAQDQFDLVYQPIFDIDGVSIRSVEALLRWNSPDKGWTLPGTFISVAEETGLILPLGYWVLEQACAQWREWLDAGVGPVRVSVNLSSRQLVDPEFVDLVEDTLQRHGVDPTFLQFELTEGVLMTRGTAATEATTALRELGITLSVDDFGTGSSSLNYLQDFPAEVLKIDSSFIAGVPGDPDSCSIVAAIVAMAHKLRMAVVAEGVETDAQLRFLQALDCEQVQGFLLGRPQSALEIEELLRGSVRRQGGPKVVAFRRRAVS
jgi:diguanylate cyclase (GGDEF)-like protein